MRKSLETKAFFKKGSLVYGLAALTLLLSSSFALVLVAEAADNVQYFPQTGFVASGKFLDYWQAHGGLAVFGFPKTPARYERDPISGQLYLSQWFERERFEYHPENAGTNYEVLLGLLGRQVTQDRQNEAPFKPVAAIPTTPSQTYFPETGHTLTNGFKSYWETKGGLAIYGYPITETFQEQNSADGKNYTVQYFERARFEYHPLNQPPYDIELGLLGNQLVSDRNSNTYFDDRSTPETLIMSFYNAIDTGQYLRAFSYWDSGSNGAPKDFGQFQNGYQNTRIVQANVGTAGTDVGAGQFYASVPVVLKAQTNNGQLQTFQACYTLHLGNPNIQGQPPFRPLEITNATANQVSNDSDAIALLNNACAALGSSRASAAVVYPTYTNTDISANRYLDSRSSPEDVVRSLYNAINSKQYVRAYSYWNTAPTDFNSFQQGYANTQSVQLTTGAVTADAGAGQFHYGVPVTVVSKNTNGSTQTFVGCYRLYLGSPGAQATPPYKPIGIEAANIQVVPNNANTVTLMSQACK